MQPILAQAKSGGRYPATAADLKELAGGAEALEKILTDPATGGKVEIIAAGRKPAFGAGTLSFHILPDEHELPAAGRAEAERQLTKPGAMRPIAGKDADTAGLANFRWLAVGNPAEFKHADVVFRPNGKGDGFVLAWDTDLSDKDGKRILRKCLRPDSGEPWGVEQVRRPLDASGQAAIGVTLNGSGGTMMGELSGGNTGRSLAIAVNGVAVNAPVIRSAFFGRLQMTGRFGEAEMTKLLKEIRAGAMVPVPLAAEPAGKDGRRVVVLSDGEVRRMTADELKAALQPAEKPKDATKP